MKRWHTSRVATWFGTSGGYISGKGTTMTIFLHPDKEAIFQTFIGEAETCQTGLAAIGVPAVRVSVSSGETFEVPEGYTCRVSSVRPVYLEERDDRGFPRIVSAEELRAGGYRLEGNLIRHTPSH